ncbi:hypothetical protein [Brachyspira alvinipulli]|uniref:hypothetical protein n=1 Tax=Brachyspira alvinipulli TaxID=84379 RepID=UPI0004AD5914|nr:hypothetical protein [Brachyspira alvinipulli]
MKRYILFNERTVEKQIDKLNEIIENNNLYKLSDELGKILYRELKAGNMIREISVGGFADENHLFIFLNASFISKAIKNSENIEYIEVNDPHYWKAEYIDLKNKQTIACPF